MNALRIRKTLDSPIPELPELSLLIGKTVEIIVLEEGLADAPSNFWASQSLEELRIAQAVSPVTSLEALVGGWPDTPDDGFEETLAGWRREIWQGIPV